jgi:hypothetical protein
VPGVTPTRSPTSKPTSDATQGNAKPSLVVQPTFPPIPKPTLTAIAEAIPFRAEDMSMPGREFGLGFAETDRVEDDTAAIDDTSFDDNVDTSTNGSQSDSSPATDRFNTAEYLDLWANIAASDAASPCIRRYFFLLFIATSMSFYLLIL